MLTRFLLGLAALVALHPPVAAAPDPSNWDKVVAAAEGQTVYWHAWAGDNRTNRYIQWVADQVWDRYGVTVEHVKLSDTAEAVSRVVAEKAAGKDTDGAVDLVWINGENFAAMKEQDLLFGPWAEQVPNWRYVDTEGKPVRTDFTVPTEGLEAPWSMAQLVFYHDTARVESPPRSIPALLDWAEANPGRFTYPQPPNFLGTTFLKQALHGLVEDPTVLRQPVAEANYGGVTEPLWAFLDALTPHLWRDGRAYPQNGPRQIQLMADGEIDIAVSFNPNVASAAIANYELPPSVRTYVLADGTIGNASFVAIPYNSGAKAGAMVVANFLMSPKAQAHKLDPEVWGAGTVLDVDGLPPEKQALFREIELGQATLPPDARGEMLPEPHPSWMTRIEQEWERRFGVAQ